MDIGLIGLGHMGAPMAARLLRAGHRLTLWNRSPDKAEALIAAGAKRAATPAEAAQGDLVITMLADDAAVEAMVYGPQGLLGQPALHVGQSTIGVALADRLFRDHGPEAYISAPVFGRPPAAEAGKLFVVAAGAAAAIDRAEPALRAVGQKLFRVGETPSAANLVKLGGNFMLVALVESFAEAMALAEAGGVERRAFYEVMTGALFDLPAARIYGEMLVTGAVRPAGFSAALGLKDMRLVDAAAAERQLPMPVLAAARDRLRAVIATHGGEVDLAALGLVAGQIAPTKDRIKP